MPFDTTPEQEQEYREAMERASRARNTVSQNPDQFTQNFTQRQPEWRWGKWDPDVNQNVSQSIKDREYINSVQWQLWSYTQDLAKKGINVQWNTITAPWGTNLNFNNNSTIQISKHTGDIYIHDWPDTVWIMSNGNITVNGDSIYKTKRQDSPGNIEQQAKFKEFSNDVKSTLFQTVGVRVEWRNILLPDGRSLPAGDNTKDVSVLSVQSAKTPNWPESVLLKVENIDNSVQVLTLTRENSNNTLQIDTEKNGNKKTIYHWSSLQNIKW